MIEPPALPSQPPPPNDDAVKPMSLYAATAWVGAGYFGLYLIASLLIALRKQTLPDQTVLLMCEACSFLLTLFGILRVYGPDKPIRAFVGLRPTHPGFYPLAMVLGVSAIAWVDWLLDRLQQRFPVEEAKHGIVELFYESSPQGRLVMGVVVAVLIPTVEELLFRGAIFGPMSKRHRMITVIVASAATFALVHSLPAVMPPIFLLGLAMGYLRAASGSLIPSIVLHVSYNGAQYVALYFTDKPALGAPAVALPAWLPVASAGAFALAFSGVVLLAKYSQLAMRARQASLDI